jgi:hypothetical protein
MMANDPGDFGVIVDVPEDALADHGVLLHLTPLVEGKGARLLQETGSEADLADIMD